MISTWQCRCYYKKLLYFELKSWYVFTKHVLCQSSLRSRKEKRYINLIKFVLNENMKSETIVLYRVLFEHIASDLLPNTTSLPKPLLLSTKSRAKYLTYLKDEKQENKKQQTRMIITANGNKLNKTLKYIK